MSTLRRAGLAIAAAALTVTAVGATAPAQAAGDTSWGGAIIGKGR